MTYCLSQRCLHFALRNLFTKVRLGGKVHHGSKQTHTKEPNAFGRAYGYSRDGIEVLENRGLDLVISGGLCRETSTDSYPENGGQQQHEQPREDLSLWKSVLVIATIPAV